MGDFVLEDNQKKGISPGKGSLPRHKTPSISDIIALMLLSKANRPLSVSICRLFYRITQLL